MKSLVTIILFSLTIPLFGQDLKPQIDSISAIHFKDKINSGLSIGIIQKGIQSQFHFGGKYTNQINDIDSVTLYEIGSVTKLYTAFILASLEAENKISRFDLLSKFLPKSVTVGKKWNTKIRLVDLATHTSGLPAFDNTKSLMNFKGFDENNPYGLFSEDFMLSILKSTDTLDNYGQIKYSNFGIGLLGYAMGRAEKVTFNQLFTKYINDKLNLKSTFLSLSEQNLTEIAIPHRKLSVMPLIQLAGLSPSGSIKTTLSDLLTFLNIHLQKPNNLRKIIETVLENQLKGSEQAVGLGWGIHKIKNETVYFHNGGTYGSSSIVILIPSKNSAVAILANNNSESALTGYALKLADKLID
jgi:CubicO group peptidase (beta-lactamase class C family)